MAKILAVTNQKGGVGKTTTSVNLAASIWLLGKSVLLVDADPQGNATSGVGVDKTALTRTIYNVMLDDTVTSDVIVKTKYGLDLLPSNTELAGGEVELATASEREWRLALALESVEGQYDYVIIDSPPSLGLLSLNTLTAAEGVIIPIQCEFYALEGVTELMGTITRVREALNPTLAIAGVLLTMYDARTNLSDQVAGEVRKFFGEKVYETVIPRTVKLAEAPSHGMPVAAYDSRSKGAAVYTMLAKEVTTRE